MKKAIILGVANPQVDAIRYLKSKGWWVIGCSYVREGRGLEHVNQFELIDIRDRHNIEALARTENVGLVYSVGSSLAMPTVADVSKRLDLPTFIDVETAELMHNKVLSRQYLEGFGISPVRYREVFTINDMDGWDIYPAMLKPADSQGQRGVFRGDSEQALLENFAGALAFSQTNTLILEEYLDGPEVSANVFLIDGKIACLQVSDRVAAGGQANGIAEGHILPSLECVGTVLEHTTALVQQCAEALKIENGPLYIQIKLTSDGPRIVEMTPRMDGCHLWRLIKQVTGADLLEATFNLLTGERPDLKAASGTGRGQLALLLSEPGEVFQASKFVVPSDAAYQEYYYVDGESVRPVNRKLETVGYYLEDS